MYRDRNCNDGTDNDLVCGRCTCCGHSGDAFRTVPVQVVSFILVSFILLLFTRPVAVKYFNKDRVRTNVESLIGQEAIVVSEIDNLEQAGRVTLQGKEWTARTEKNGVKIPVGSVVIVKSIDGVKLIVEERKED